MVVNNIIFGMMYFTISIHNIYPFLPTRQISHHSYAHSNTLELYTTKCHTYKPFITSITTVTYTITYMARRYPTGRIAGELKLTVESNQPSQIIIS